MVFAKLGDSQQQFGGSCPLDWIEMASPGLVGLSIDSPMYHNFYYVLSTTWRVQYTSPFD